MALYQKAYICPYKGGRPSLEEKFYVQFNPSELNIEEAIGVTDTDDHSSYEYISKLLKGNRVGLQHPMKSSLADKKNNRLTLNTTLFFNTLEKINQDSYEDVRKYIRQLYPYTNKATDSKQNVVQIYFFWGSIVVAGILNRMNVRYTMFAPDGRPVRAQVDISIVGDYVGDKSNDSAAGVATGKGNAFGSNEINTLLADDPSNWRNRYRGIGNPRYKTR